MTLFTFSLVRALALVFGLGLSSTVFAQQLLISASSGTSMETIQKIVTALESKVSASVVMQADAPLRSVRNAPEVAAFTATAASFTAKVATFPSSASSVGLKPTFISDASQGAQVEKLAMNVAKRYRIETGVAQVIVEAAHSAAHELGLSPRLILGVIARESSFDPEAINNKDLGLMQVNLKWHADKIKAVGGADAMFDPIVNIRVGAKVLKEYLKASNGDVFQALRRYHGLDKVNDYPQEVIALMHSF